MNVKRTTARIPQADVPYSPKNKAETLKYWEDATAHKGVAELRAKRGRPAKVAEERKEQLSALDTGQIGSLLKSNGWQRSNNSFKPSPLRGLVHVL